MRAIRDKKLFKTFCSKLQQINQKVGAVFLLTNFIVQTIYNSIFVIGDSERKSFEMLPHKRKMLLLVRIFEKSSNGKF